MIDFNDIGKYKENNRIEAKKAIGGLPHSIWDTYSAFANTIGGIILLGVDELQDKSLKTVTLPNPEKLVKEFWDAINDTQQVNANILYDKDVQIVEVDGNRIVTIEVPRANRHDKPVFIGQNPFKGTYRRNGEGDYHCTEIEVRNMLRDGGDVSQDLTVLEDMSLDVFDYESLKRYRIRMSNLRPGHVWEGFPDNEFLYKLGAVNKSKNSNQLHPTIAGLLMFGFEYEIVKEFPNYFLDYCEKLDDNVRWSDRIMSSSGDWSGNIFDFYFRVYNKIVQDIKVPFKLENGTDRIDDTPVHKALREALANALIHANYYDRQGLVIEKKMNEIIIANPGCLRISIDEAVSGGISDPRNATLIKMFSLVGSGLPNIHAVWKQQGWSTPKLQEGFNPDRTILSLELLKNSNKKVAVKSGGKKVATKSGDKTIINKNAIIEFMTDRPFVKSSEIIELLSLSQSRVKKLLAELQEEDIIVKEGSNKNRVYKLKS